MADATTLEIYGISCKIPPQPKRGEIDGSRRQAKKQRFERVEVPESFKDVEFDEENNPVFTADQQKFIDVEFNKIQNGYWFYNNGTPTYITGRYYRYLNYWKLEDGSRPEYRDADRRFFLFFDECYNDPQILGIVRLKKRREGASSQGAAIMVDITTMDYNQRGGLVSKTGDDAKKLFIEMVVYAFKAQPIFLHPRWDGTEEPKTELNFIKPVSKKRKVKANTEREGLNSSISWKNTVLNSYDSGRLSFLLLDESGKFPKDCPIDRYWGIVKKTLIQGAKKVGFAYLPTTCNPEAKGGKEFKKIWENSNQFVYGRKTPTGLVQYFQPANDGFAGFIDEHGYSMLEEAKDHILTQRDLITDIELKSDEIRDFPLNEQEPFQFAEEESYFNIENITNQENWLKVNQPYLRRGKLYPKNGHEIDFADDKNGNWIILKFPKNKNHVSVRNGRVFPENGHNYGIGSDPFRAQIISGAGSKGVIVGGTKLDIDNPEETGMPEMLYIGRTKLKEDFWREILMACLFCGCKATIEKDAGDDFIQYFQKNNPFGLNCLPLLGKKPDAAIDPERRKSRFQLDYGYKSADPFVLAKQLEVAINYFERHTHKIKFAEILKDAKAYRHDERTPYDITCAFMAWLLSILGDTKMQKTAERKAPLIETYVPKIWS